MELGAANVIDLADLEAEDIDGLELADDERAALEEAVRRLKEERDD